MLYDISYKDYKKKSDIHGTILYPAVMVAPIQKDVLEDLISDVDKVSIFDPFHGSGTALYESMEISNNVTLTGCDINPLANLITKVKLQGISNTIYDDIELLKISIQNISETNIHLFRNINKWFRQDIIEDLSKIRLSIMKVNDIKNRLFFWYNMCDVIRKYSNTRSSTYKLHIKPLDQISRMKNNVIKDYLSSLENNIEKFQNRASNYKLYKCDTLTQIKKFNDIQFDISITSPPYGDNATTVTYGQFSMLPLFWIDPKDLEIEGWELDNYSKIDSMSLGGKSKEIKLSDLELSLIIKYLHKISDSKQRKVMLFFNDYFSFLNELCRVTKHNIVMTLGNRTVDGITIDLTEITTLFLESKNFINKQIIEREIQNKRMAPKTSKVNNKSVKSINFEYLIIHERILNY